MPQFDAKSMEALVAASLRDSPPSVRAAAEPKKKGASKWALGASLLGDAADAASTVYARNRGAVEKNPLLGSHPSTGKVLAFKAGTGALKALLTHALGKKHPKAANILGGVNGAVNGAVAVHNVVQGRKGER